MHVLGCPVGLGGQKGYGPRWHGPCCREYALQSSKGSGHEERPLVGGPKILESARCVEQGENLTLPGGGRRELEVASRGSLGASIADGSPMAASVGWGRRKPAVMATGRGEAGVGMGSRGSSPCAGWGSCTAGTQDPPLRGSPRRPTCEINSRSLLPARAARCPRGWPSHRGPG